MRKAGEAALFPHPPSTWPRRALVGLWLLAFLVAGGTLAARWDDLMARLARPPAADEAAGGPVR